MTKKRVQTRFKHPVLRRTFIRAWRLHRGQSLEEAAAAIGKHLEGGFTHASLSRIERGLQPYSQPILEALAIELDTDVASLLMRDPSDASFWSVWDRLKDDEKEDVSKYALFVQEKRAKTGT